MIKYLILDTESGSRHPTSTLLSAYFLALDENFNELEEMYLKLKPDNNDHYIVDAQGLEVNKINLVEHDKIAQSYKQVKPAFYNFLMRNSGTSKLTPVGHATTGDIKRCTDNIISEGSWEQFCTYHFIDTSVVLQFLRACGKMPVDMDGSVGSLASYFNIKIDGELHDARTDAKITAEILKEFIKLGKS